MNNFHVDMLINTRRSVVQTLGSLKRPLQPIFVHSSHTYSMCHGKHFNPPCYLPSQKSVNAACSFLSHIMYYLDMAVKKRIFDIHILSPYSLFIHYVHHIFQWNCYTNCHIHLYWCHINSLSHVLLFFVFVYIIRCTPSRLHFDISVDSTCCIGFIDKYFLMWISESYCNKLQG